MTPEEVNLSQGLAGTLADKIYVHEAKEAELSGINELEQVKMWKATAEENLQLHDNMSVA